MTHLDDIAFNEYLDSALDPARHAEVEAHLAACPDCAARLAGLRALFAALESLPDVPLERDLSSSVVTALRKSRGMSDSAKALRLRPTLRFAFAAQALAALILLAIALPFATQATLWEQV
ncbi:MAG: zf-HC2 domain-containing protein, partial [Chloroflexi bacterium]|nr:zf-HC2 domain-containing protein [Chloroflexota bacterium]